MTRWAVLKFGGASVAAPENWRTIARLIAERRADGLAPFVLHSALAGVSDLLEALPDAALKGEHEPVVDRLRQRHADFSAAAGLDAPALLAAHFERIERVAAGIALTGEASPRLRAALLAEGELMANALGAAKLAALGVTAEAFDSREALRALPGAAGETEYLSAACDEGANAALQAALTAKLDAGAGAILAPGFIARATNGGTVLLGRGGSDTSAAYFAAILQAEVLEIWTDVPGMFSADPRLTPAARLLKRLSYDEAREIATMGAKVLHPRCIGPAQRAGVPVMVRDTFRPEMQGTRIEARPGDDAPRVKAVSLKTGVRLVSLETAGMWRQVGFLADAFAAFKRNGVSIDLVSTSETNVTVSLDPDPSLDAARLDRLQADLSKIAQVTLVENAAAVSLVGYGVRRILHELAPAFEAFQDRPVLLVSQAANDLNFTVVVGAEDGRTLAARLHERMIRPVPDDPVFGPAWGDIASPAADRPAPAPWWREKREALLKLAPQDAPLYVYDLATVRARANALAALKAPARRWYAMKANSHPDVLRAIHAQGFGVECVSPGEIEHAMRSIPGLTPDEILFTPNFAPRGEYEAAFGTGVHVTVDGLHPLAEWPEVFKGRDIILRLNPDRPRGHHAHVRTAGPKAKFGIPLDQAGEAARLAQAAGARVTGLHAHAGSGVMEAGHWQAVGEILAQAAKAHFPQARILNPGGGLGAPDGPDAPALDLAAVDTGLMALKAAHPGFELWLEPGRYLVAEAGVLLARVTQIKTTGGARFIGVTAGMNSLIRPALYGARHEMVNLTRLGEPATGLFSIVGPVCESADLLGAGRLMPEPAQGDVIAILNAGAYGAVMASRYNLREPAGEAAI